MVTQREAELAVAERTADRTRILADSTPLQFRNSMKMWRASERPPLP
jgi:hypothetical protein